MSTPPSPEIKPRKSQNSGKAVFGTVTFKQKGIFNHKTAASDQTLFNSI